jgi:gamma-glutamylcyclotransferase (GGCT)/AIG2-like uncharacterized protein YtfP
VKQDEVMNANVFTYGSLMFPAVWERVVRGRYRSAPVLLEHYARYAIRSETYPGMVVLPGMQVAGVLYYEVSENDLAALDAFEGAEYRREQVRVTTTDGGKVDAHTYVYLLPEKLSSDSWEPERFQMERFLGTYCVDKLGGPEGNREGN